MYFSRIVPIDSNRVAVQLSNEYATHQLVWKWFSLSPNQSRNFLYRMDTEKGIRIYTYSSEPPRVDESLFRCDSKLFDYVAYSENH